MWEPKEGNPFPYCSSQGLSLADVRKAKVVKSMLGTHRIFGKTRKIFGGYIAENNAHNQIAEPVSWIYRHCCCWADSLCADATTGGPVCQFQSCCLLPLGTG